MLDLIYQLFIHAIRQHSKVTVFEVIEMLPMNRLDGSKYILGRSLEVQTDIAKTQHEGQGLGMQARDCARTVGCSNSLADSEVLAPQSIDEK